MYGLGLFVIEFNEENGEEPGAFENIDCSYTFDTSQVLIWFYISLK